MSILDLDIVRYEMKKSKRYFSHLSPGIQHLARGKGAVYLKRAFKALMISREARALYNRAHTPEQFAGRVIANMGISKVTAPARAKVMDVHRHIPHIPRKDLWRKNGLGGRYWIYKPGRHKMVVVFHDANRAGPHIDIHIGRFSMIRRVKPEVYEQLRYNRDGMLTQNSQKILLDFLREEVRNGSRIPQNLDHTVANARASWTGGSREDQGYGSGITRQVVLEEEVEVYKAHAGGPIEIYAPSINPNRGTYVYKLYSGDDVRAPILIWGSLTSQPPVLEDRLHLTLVQPDDLDDLTDRGRAELVTSTAKYDGSSCYFVITPKGTTVWSPRQSKLTGEQIEYTFKLDGVANTTSPETIVGMGEVMFRKPHDWLPFFYNRGEYTAQAEAGGILNSNAVSPRHLAPEIRVYRIDRIGRSRTIDLDFWSNRALQKHVEKLNPDVFKVVELMTPEEAKLHGFEGVVLGKSEDSVVDFYKTKWWSDPHDWQLESVDLYPGPRGGIAGVAHFTSLESGKSFKLGPGQLGDNEFNLSLMEDPDRYEGSVWKVHSRHGHEGRASKLLGPHPDKGQAPV